MKNNIKNGRREFLSKSVGSTILLGAAITPIGVMLQSFSLAKHPQSAANEAQFRTELAKLGTKSLLTAQIAQTKASNEKVKMFAKFETAEQTTIAAILKELGTPTPPPDTQAQALMTNLNAANGAAFDKVFMKAQVETHEALKALTSGYVNAAKGKTTPAEVHTRHLASLALATITEHTEKAKKIVGELA